MNALDQPNFKINNELTDPSNLDFNILGFKKHRTIISGELRVIDYYNNYDPLTNTYTDIVIKEEREYFRDPIGIVQYRTNTIYWYLTDETIGLVKIWDKYYSPEEAIQEGIDRRNNMVSFAKTSLLNDLKEIYGEPTNQTYAFDLLLSLATQMSYFKEGYTQPLRDAISASTKPYLTETIKNNILTQLDF